MKEALIIGLAPNALTIKTGLNWYSESEKVPQKRKARQQRQIKHKRAPSFAEVARRGHMWIAIPSTLQDIHQQKGRIKTEVIEKQSYKGNNKEGIHVTVLQWINGSMC